MTSIRVHCFQHVFFEDIGIIDQWIRHHGHILSYTRFFEPDPVIPDVVDYDLLVVMGGPMGVNDEQDHPWLPGEKKAIREAVRAGKKVLAICLGAQLTAQVLGAEVTRNPEKEIGWFNVYPTKEAAENNIFKGVLDYKMTVFHWHGDTFGIPEGAGLMAFSLACKNQAFVYENRVVGLQFHFEVTEKSLRLMLENGRDELEEALFVHSEKHILDQSADRLFDCNLAMLKILDNLCADCPPEH